MVQILAIVILFGLLISVHELGHMIGAKLSNIRVEKFSIGFGPPILKWKKKETEYMISALPLGGYVKLEGEEFEGENNFYAKPFHKKMTVTLGGPFLNFMFAFFLIFIINIFWGEENYAPLLYVPSKSELYKQGLRTGDSIILVDGRSIKNFKDIVLKLSISDKSHEITLNRDGKILNLNIKIKNPSSLEALIKPVVAKVVKNSPAEKIGIKPNDTIIEINNTKVKAWQQVFELISKAPDSIIIKWIHKEDTLSSYVKPVPMEGGKKIGVWVKLPKKRLQVPVALINAAGKTLRISWQVVYAFYGLITGKVSIKNLGGPLFLAQASAKVSKLGIWYFISLLALLSINLGIINLFPIPALDGGRALIFTTEKILQKRFSKKTWMIAVQIGYILIIILLIIATFNDILRLFKK